MEKMSKPDSQILKPKSIEGLPIGRLALTVREIQQALGIGRDAAYALANRADFPAIRLNGSRKIIIPRDAFYRWLEAQTAGKTKGGCA